MRACLKTKNHMLGMVVYGFHLSTYEADSSELEAGLDYPVR